jgi:arginine decarboxylase
MDTLGDMDTLMDWSVEQSRQLYRINTWGDGYFDIDDRGHVIVFPHADRNKPCINLYELANSIRQHDLQLPVLVRFIDVLEHRVDSLIDCFSKARAQFSFLGSYVPVYPIKVNQQNTVIEGILKSNPDVVGLEAGSRAELLAIIALSRGGVIVCNGYKDKTYIRLALIAVRMGLQVILVIEQLSELKLVIQEAEKLDVEPQLGVRIRLSNIGDNRWQNSGGEKSKFGLGPAHVLSLVKQLSQCNRLHWLTMMHVHIGSQVTRLDSFESGLREAGRFHAELHRLGARITTLDVGGGLAVDYEGSGSVDFCSMNYSMETYAQTIIRCVKQTCDRYHLPEPDILTESGRAMTAHHSVLITNVVDVEKLTQPNVVSSPVVTNSQQLIQKSEQIHQKLKQIRADYITGLLDLQLLAEAESSCYYQLQTIRDQLNRSQLSTTTQFSADEALNYLNEKLADKVFCNFSLFQSMPDAWAFQQRFPIMPLSRHNEKPSRRGVIQDLTCDSDGSVTHYVEQQGIESTMPLHDISEGEEYYLGFFLLGAYQEILGDMHNLFGDTNAINIHLDEQGQSHYYSPSKGDTVADLLRYVHIEPELILEQLQLKLDNADLQPELKQEFETMFTSTLQQGTYLEQPE